MGQLKFFGSLLMISVFAFALIAYAVNFAIDNNTNVNIANDSDYSTFNSSLTSSMNQFVVETNSTANAFGQTDIQGTDSTTVTGGEFKVGMGAPASGLKAVVSIIKSKLFGNNPAFGYVLSVLVAFVILSIALYIWQTWKGGNPSG